MADVANEILQIINGKLNDTSNRLQLSDALEETGLNSLEVVDLIFDIEERFDIQIPFNANFDIAAKTVSDLVHAVEGLVAAKAGAA